MCRPARMGFAAEMLVGGIVALGVSAAFGERWHLPDTREVWAAWAYLVVFGSLIAFSAYRYLVDRVSPTLAATYAYVNPPVALFVGWWIGAEHFAPNTFIGLPIVLVAVGLHAWSWRKATMSNAQAEAGTRDASRGVVDGAATAHRRNQAPAIRNATEARKPSIAGRLRRSARQRPKANGKAAGYEACGQEPERRARHQLVHWNSASVFA